MEAGAEVYKSSLPQGAKVDPEYSPFALGGCFLYLESLQKMIGGFVVDVLPRGEGVEQRARGNRPPTRQI